MMLRGVLPLTSASQVQSYLLDEYLSGSRVLHAPHRVGTSSPHLHVCCFDQPIRLILSIALGSPV
jgi:hypothetical protein